MTAAECKIQGRDGVIAPSASNPQRPEHRSSKWLQRKYTIITRSDDWNEKKKVRIHNTHQK